MKRHLCNWAVMYTNEGSCGYYFNDRVGLFAISSTRQRARESAATLKKVHPTFKFSVVKLTRRQYLNLLDYELRFADMVLDNSQQM